MATNKIKDMTFSDFIALVEDVEARKKDNNYERFKELATNICNSLNELHEEFPWLVWNSNSKDEEPINIFDYFDKFYITDFDDLY